MNRNWHLRRPNPVLEQIIKTLLFLTLVYKNGMKILVIHPSNMKLWELMNSYKAPSQRKSLWEREAINSSCTFLSFQDNSDCKFSVPLSGHRSGFGPDFSAKHNQTALPCGPKTVKILYSQEVPRKSNKEYIERRRLGNFSNIRYISYMLICTTDLQTS